MATSYWDYYGSDTSATGGYLPNGITTGTQSTASGSLWWYYPTEVIKQRKLLVYKPDKWTDEQNMKFVELVNIKTKTGWKVTLVIKGGDILITDPDVEKRDMIDFIPLLKDRATATEIGIINEFFKSNPVE